MPRNQVQKRSLSPAEFIHQQSWRFRHGLMMVTLIQDKNSIMFWNRYLNNTGQNRTQIDYVN
jgi:hypothetical protein